MAKVMSLEKDLNFDSICRLCLTSDKELNDIFQIGAEPNSSEWTLVDKILDCTSLKVNKKDGLPSQICPDCNTLVDALHNFKRRCASSDLTLRDYIQKRDPDYKVKSEPAAPIAEAAQTGEQSNNDVVESKPSTSPSRDSKWACEAVDVEAKVEITTEPSVVTNIRQPEKRLRGKSSKMSPFIDAYPCSQCNKVFAHKNSLTRHETSHSDEKFTCMYCNKMLSTRDTLIRHVKAHRGDKRHRCEICGKQYTSSTSYSTHIRKHTGERPFKCPECKECFSLPSSLERHIAKHGGTKSFRCDLCGASFWVSDDLRCHVNRVH